MHEVFHPVSGLTQAQLLGEDTGRNEDQQFGLVVLAFVVAEEITEARQIAQRLKAILESRGATVVDFFADPAAANKIILEVVKQYDTGWVYTQRNADYAVETMKKLKLVGNSAMGAVGGFDEKRVQRIIDVTSPIFAKQNSPAADGLTPEKVATNQFIDKSVVMG